MSATQSDMAGDCLLLQLGSWQSSHPVGRRQALDTHYSQVTVKAMSVVREQFADSKSKGFLVYTHQVFLNVKNSSRLQ